MRRLLASVALLATLAAAQGARYDNVAQSTTPTATGGSLVIPVPGASITVCPATSSGIPCSPTAAIYSDAALTQAVTQPIAADTQGNFGFYIAPGQYEYTITAAGYAGTTHYFTVAAGVSGANNLTAQSIEQVRYADRFTGSDMGAQVIAAGTDCSNNCTVVVPTGPAGGYPISANETLPAGITLRFEQGAMLSPAAGITVTIHSGIDAGNYQIFGGAGTVSFAGNTAIARLPITWWGAVGDGTTVDTTAAQAAMTAGESGVGIVYVPTGTYLMCGVQAGNPATKVISGSAQAPGPSVIGDARFQSVLQATSGCTGWVVQRNNTSGLVYRDFEVNGGGTAKGADFSWFSNGPSTRDEFRNIWVRDYKTEALDLDNQNDAVIDGIAVDGQNAPTDIAISAVGVGGQIFLSNVQVNNGVANLAAQSGECVNCNFLDGVAISASGTNSWSFQGGQIWPNGSCAGCSGTGTTGIALNLTNAGVPGTTGVFGSGMYFPGATGMTDFAGNWGGGLTCEGCFVGGTAFGTISGTRAGSLPTFSFIGSSVPSGTESTSTYNVSLVSSGSPDQLYAFGYLGGLGNCASAAPPGLGTGGFATCWNYSAGAGETDIFSSKGTASAASIRFYDWNGGTSPTLMATLNDAGMTLGPSALTVATTMAGSLTASTTAVAANTCADAVTATITGATTSMALATGLSGAPQAGLRPYAYISAANTVTFEWCNDTASSITPNAQTVQLRVIQ